MFWNPIYPWFYPNLSGHKFDNRVYTKILKWLRVLIPNIRHKVWNTCSAPFVRKDRIYAAFVAEIYFTLESTIVIPSQHPITDHYRPASETPFDGVSLAVRWWPHFTCLLGRLGYALWTLYAHVRRMMFQFLYFVCVFFFQADRVEEQFTFQYGPCKGDPGFREQLANFLSQEYGDVVDR